jgi:CBS domain-containing protein
MRSRFITLSPATSLRDAEQVMRVARVRYVPVVRGERLVGLLANRDVLAHSLACGAGLSGTELRRLLSRVSVGSLVKVVEGVSPDDLVHSVALRFIEDGRGCLPVVTPGPSGPHLVGLLTENDLLRAAFRRRPSADSGAGKPEPRGEAKESSAPQK